MSAGCRKGKDGRGAASGHTIAVFISGSKECINVDIMKKRSRAGASRAGAAREVNDAGCA